MVTLDGLSRRIIRVTYKSGMEVRWTDIAVPKRVKIPLKSKIQNTLKDKITTSARAFGTTFILYLLFSERKSMLGLKFLR